MAPTTRSTTRLPRRALGNTTEPQDRATHYQDPEPETPTQTAQTSQARPRSQPSTLPIPLPFDVPYNPGLRMDNLTTRMLLEMVQAWKYYLKQVGGGWQDEHVHLTRVMGELVARGVLNGNRIFAVDLRTVDLDFVRA